MKFLLYSATDVMDASSNGIANALERLGHGVSRWQRRQEFPATEIAVCAELYRVDCFIFFGGKEMVFSGETVIYGFRRRFPQAIFIMWNFDVMTNSDTWAWFEPLARACDLCIQMDDSKPEQWEGINRIFCHMGIDPAIEKPFQGTITAEDHAKYDADVAFMGMAYDFGGRKRTLDLVQDWCRQNGKIFKLWGLWTEYLIGDELAKMIACTKVHLGHEPEGRPANHWSQRVYTILAHGGFYFAKFVNGYEKEFQNGSALAFWYTAEDLIEKLPQWIASGRRPEIAQWGCNHVRAYKTWDKRVSSVLPEIEATLARRRA